MSSSLKAEFASREYRSDNDFGRGLGFSYLILSFLGVVPMIGWLFSIGALIAWVMYWRSVSANAKMLAASREIARQYA